ncbi:hypothetical protein A2U01_0026285, partial [Trifolium medium]|nr:hypothetical protein [Trifolium medium]
MPLALVEKYNIGTPRLTSKMELIMANKAVINPYGMIEDVLVKVKDLLGEFTLGIKEEKRTIKVYGKPDNHCYKVETKDKELEDAPTKTNPVWEDESIEIDERQSFEEFNWLESTYGEIIPNWDTMFPEPTSFIPRPKSKEHQEWIKRWKRHYKVATRSKFGMKDQNQKETGGTNVVTLLVKESVVILRTTP